jgi:hypothetical protein
LFCDDNTGESLPGRIFEALADLGIGLDLDIYLPEGTELLTSVPGTSATKTTGSAVLERNPAVPCMAAPAVPTAAKSKQQQVDYSPIKSSRSAAGLLRELADRHVRDHAPTQRADSLLGHGAALVLSEGCEPPISRQDAPIRYLNEPR